jgi:hypothetical protein
MSLEPEQEEEVEVVKMVWDESTLAKATENWRAQVGLLSNVVSAHHTLNANRPPLWAFEDVIIVLTNLL